MNIDVPSLLLSFLFSVIGMAYFAFGKKRSEPRFLIVGVLLMGFTYFVDSMGWTLAIGAGLSLAPIIMQSLNL